MSQLPATALTLRQQLLRSHLRVAGIAAFTIAIAAIAMHLLTQPMIQMQSEKVPSAHAAMRIQLGLQRSNAVLHAWIALRQPDLRESIDSAWRDEIDPAFASLDSLSDSANPEQSETLLTLRKKLERLKKVQLWIADVADKPGNEPARLVFTQELLPVEARLESELNALREHRSSAQDMLLSLTQVGASLGRFVVEGHERDAQAYAEKMARLRGLIEHLDESSSGAASQTLLVDLEMYRRLADSIIESRRSPRSNVAWHTVRTNARPLAAEIEGHLERVAMHELTAMRHSIQHIVDCTRLLAFGALIALGIVVLFALVLAHSEARWISAPVERLGLATDALSRGENPESLPVEGVTEVQGLLQSFNSMRTSIARSHEQLRSMAFTDELTGLPNRKSFNESMSSLAERKNRSRRYVGVALIDLDYFKLINDSLGHDAGDEVLSIFGHRLNSCLRDGDQAARLGGDEFAVVMESLSAPHDAELVIERIQNETSKPIVYKGEKITPSATVGLAIAKIDDVESTDLLKQADLALYAAKEHMRGTFRFYSPEIHKKAERSRRILEIVEHQKPEQIFEIAYQPYVDLTSQEVLGAEALLRWASDEYQDISTIEMIEMIERRGPLMARVSEWILRTAVTQLEQWTEASGDNQLTMSVNMSPGLLREASFIDCVRNVLARSSIRGEQLILELTETMVMDDYERSREAMSQLSEMGVQFALDDFGTGYSSLVRLKQMPVSVLKIDQTFVSDMSVDRSDAAIVEASVRLGHTIGMKITAEGIETEAQLRALQELGCDTGQGFYFASPSTGEELPVGRIPPRVLALA